MDLQYIIDEHLHAYTKEVEILCNARTYIRLFVSVTKSEAVSSLLNESISKMKEQSTNGGAPLKYIGDASYEMYILHDTDVLVIHQAL